MSPLRQKESWAVVCDDPRLGPLIFSTHRTHEKAISERRDHDWLVMPVQDAIWRQHKWMQNPERWRAFAAQERLIHDLKTDLTIAKSSIAAAYEPISAGDGMTGPLFDVMNRVRARLAGVGRVRPRVLASGRPSSSEFEIGMTVHDGEALLSVLPERMDL